MPNIALSSRAAATEAPMLFDSIPRGHQWHDSRSGLERDGPCSDSPISHLRGLCLRARTGLGVSMTPPQWLVFELSSHYGASAENGASHHPRQAEPRAMVAPPHTQLIYLRCNSVVTVLITPEVFEMSPNRRQSDPPANQRQITRAKPTTSAGKSLQSS